MAGRWRSGLLLVRVVGSSVLQWSLQLDNTVRGRSDRESARERWRYKKQLKGLRVDSDSCAVGTAAAGDGRGSCQQPSVGSGGREDIGSRGRADVGIRGGRGSTGEALGERERERAEV
ncbi:hypothetical protein CRG98_032051 [Punica granatum]|uniref:Secreted protein n=1 Tax=Punica granatum TaxID=22663 RepID=A0A2I0IU74_PUNGR|nr:hypothetical protein CRG98_032051 [Punica granatum]